MSAISLPVIASPLLSTTQVAARIGLSANAVIALCDSGQLAHFRIGAGAKKRYRIAEEDLAAYVESCRQAAADVSKSDAPKQREAANEGFKMLRLGGFRN